MQEKQREKSLIKRNILQYIDYKGISDYKFYKDSGITRGVLSQNNGLSEDNMMRFLAYAPDVNLTWLLTGRGNMLITEDTQLSGVNVAEQFPLRTDRKLDLQSVPLYELDATAGLVALFSDTTRSAPINYLQIPDLPPCDGAIYVRGDSMYPLLKSGDIVLYKQVHDMQYGIFWGEMYLISANVDGDEFVTIKYIHKSERENCVKLVSHNQHHEPKDIPISMIRALALVKASVRYNTIR